MKAFVYYECGPPEVLRIEDVPMPEPGDREVLIQVRAAALNPLDWRLLEGGPYLVRKMLGKDRKGIGRDVSGRVTAVGKLVNEFQPGDDVFGVCRGSVAEYACTPAHAVHKKPANITFEQAASVPVAALTALQGLRDKGRLQRGQKVLINGAAGGVGTFAVQIAKSYGAEVTGICSASNLEMVRSIGADHVIDYTREDFVKSERRYDVLLDCVANRSLSDCRQVLTPRGVCVIVGAPKKASTIVARSLLAVMWSPFTARKMILFIAKRIPGDFVELSDLMAAERVTPVIDRCYPFEETVEAVRYGKQGHARGKVVIVVSQDAGS